MSTYLEMMLSDGVLHCDPHPGNLLRTADGRLCILDWGLVTTIDADLQLTLIEHVAHLTAEDYAKVSKYLYIYLSVSMYVLLLYCTHNQYGLGLTPLTRTLIEHVAHLTAEDYAKVDRYLYIYIAVYLYVLTGGSAFWTGDSSPQLTLICSLHSLSTSPISPLKTTLRWIHIYTYIYLSICII